MKPYKITILILLAVLLTVCVSGCGEEPAEPTPLPTVQLSPIPSAPPTPTPTPKPSIGPYFEPTVTKDPGDEERVEGSCIYFSAFAEDALRCDWELVREDRVLTGTDIVAEFPEMVAAGIYDNYLILGNIPLELDGWSVRCRFTGSGEAVVRSEEALITVFERTVKIHGEARKTVRGTGNLSGYGAIIDYEGEDWWVVEEYADATFTMLPGDRPYGSEFSEVSLTVNENGSLQLTLGDRQYNGIVSSERIGGHSASAAVFADGTDAELSLFFDYTEQCQRDEIWNKIWIEIPVEYPVEDTEAPAAAETDGTSEVESPPPETEFRTLRFTLSRVPK